MKPKKKQLTIPKEITPIYIDSDKSDNNITNKCKLMLKYYNREYYHSCVLTRPERRYCVTRRKLLVVVFLLDMSDHIFWEGSFGFILIMDP